MSDTARQRLQNERKVGATCFLISPSALYGSRKNPTLNSAFSVRSYFSFLFLTLLSFTHLSNGTEIQKGKAFWILCSSCKERRWLCEPLYLGVWHPWKGRGMLLSLSNILPFHNICASPLTPPLYPYTYVFPLLTMTDYIRRPYSTFSLEIPR